MSPMVEAALISASAIVTSAAVGLGGVMLTIRSQTKRIDADNKARLDAQTSEIKQHVTGGGKSP